MEKVTKYLKTLDEYNTANNYIIRLLNENLDKGGDELKKILNKYKIVIKIDNDEIDEIVKTNNIPKNEKLTKYLKTLDEYNTANNYIIRSLNENLDKGGDELKKILNKYKIVIKINNEEIDKIVESLSPKKLKEYNLDATRDCIPKEISKLTKASWTDLNKLPKISVSNENKIIEIESDLLKEKLPDNIKLFYEDTEKDKIKFAEYIKDGNKFKFNDNILIF